MSWIYFVDLFGTCVFAISGVVTAINKKFDLVGTLIIGFVTAIGGGTVRDILIGRTPVGWITDRNYFLVIIAGYIFAYCFKNKVVEHKRSFFVFDTIGIGLFTILGIEVALENNLNVEICLIMGVVSACFGGVIRDVLTNEIPLIFRAEIYASACLLGGIIYVLLRDTIQIENVSIVISIISVIIIRILSIKYNWSLKWK